MSKQYKISQLIMNNETPYYRHGEEVEKYDRVREVSDADKTRYLTWVDDKHMESIATPEGRELTKEELFDFIIGNDITDFARDKNISKNSADIAIVLGNIGLPTTRERAIKAFELYKKGIVKKIIFTGGIPKSRDVNGYMHPTSIEEYKDNNEINKEWSDLAEADWGSETFIPDMFDENYQEHVKKLTDKFLEDTGINPEDVLTEAMSSSTQENAEFCKNIFESEEMETGLKIRSAIVVTTCTHGSRAMRQFKKVFGDKVSLKWCPSTLDLEKDESLKEILNAQDFDQVAFRQELKRIYCTVPELTQKLREETANHRNAFILGDIDDATITTIDNEKESSHDDDLEQ